MKIEKLIKKLQHIEEKNGNIEVLIADRPMDCNSEHENHKEFMVLDTCIENGEKAIIIGIEGEDGL